MIKSAFLIYSDTYLGVTDDRATAVARAEAHHHEARVAEVALVDVLSIHPPPTDDERWQHHERQALMHTEAMERLRPGSSSLGTRTRVVALTEAEVASLAVLGDRLAREPSRAHVPTREAIAAIARMTGGLSLTRDLRADEDDRAVEAGTRDLRVAEAERAVEVARDVVNGQRVLVHADGGDCHGLPIVNGLCAGCGLSPDTQSTELWSRDQVRRQTGVIKCPGCGRSPRSPTTFRGSTWCTLCVDRHLTSEERSL